GKKVADVLKGLDFKVTTAADLVTREQFLQIYLLPFANSIEEGDIVVFYFSGHGFTYGGENFLAPLEFPGTVKETQILSTFISVTSVQRLLNDRRPSFLLVLLDACRDIGAFVIQNVDGRSQTLIAKGLGEPSLPAQ